MFRQRKKESLVVKGAANARLLHLRPQQLGTQGFLCLSNIYPLVAWDSAWDGKQDEVLLGPGSASLHTSTNREESKQTDWQIQMSETHMQLPRPRYVREGELQFKASSLLSEQVASGRVQGRAGDRLLTARLYSAAAR